MARSKVVFIGEENKTNSELYQLLNWRFDVQYYSCIGENSFSEVPQIAPNLVVASMVGKLEDYSKLLEYLKKECSDIPVIMFGAKSEIDVYADLCETNQFHKVLRPVTGKRVLEICRDVITGKTSVERNDIAKSDACEREEKAHILIVDDNAMVLRNIKGILEDNYSVAVAPSGFHAFVSMGKKMPDLILLDYEMPEMNGKEVLEKLQSDEELKEIPVVFLTSVDSKETVMELLALKPAGYILKPVESEMLNNKIQEIIGK